VRVDVRGIFLPFSDSFNTTICRCERLAHCIKPAVSPVVFRFVVTDPTIEPAAVGKPHSPSGRAVTWLAFQEGVRATAPTLIATSIWGLVAGVAMVRSGLSENMALTMTLLVYAGSAQLTSLPLIASGAPLWLVFAAGFVVNLRFVIFSAALQPYFRTLSWPRRLALGYFTTDVSFVLFISRFGEAKRRGTPAQRGFFIGAITPGWFVWQLASVVGIFVGAAVPSAWPLDFVAVLALMGVVLPLIKTRPVLVAALAASVAAWLGQSLPLRLGMIAAIIAGVIAGMCAERWPEKKR